MNPLKIAVITSNGAALPLVALLAQRQQLAGVLLSGQWDLEKQQIEAQLRHSDIPVAYYASDDTDRAISTLTAWKSTLGIVFCCGEKVPATIAQVPEHGMINFHGSALPEYRGPDPLYWQIRNGETQLMLTAHLLEETFDTGPILAQRPVTIGPHDTSHRVFNSLLQAIPPMLDTLLDQLQQQGHLQSQPQQGIPSHKAPRLREEDLLIDWQQLSAKQLCNQVRAGNPQYGGARLVLGEGHAQLLQASPVNMPDYGATPGTIIHLSPEQGLIVALRSDSIRLDIIANNDGVFDGYRFAHCYQLAAGMQFQSPGKAIRNRGDNGQSPIQNSAVIS